MAKLPPFKFSPKGFQFLEPEPVKHPHADALIGADDETLELLLSLMARIEATGDRAKVERATHFNDGALIAFSEKSWVFWQERNRVLWWLATDQIRGRVWPDVVTRHSPTLLPPSPEVGSEWRIEANEGGFLCKCNLSPKQNLMKSPSGLRFADRYLRQPSPSQKPSGKARKDEDDGMLAHALRPRTEEFAP